MIEGFVLFVLDLFAGLGECPLRVALRVFGGLCDQLPWAEALALTSIPPPGA